MEQKRIDELEKRLAALEREIQEPLEKIIARISSEVSKGVRGEP
jgi:hypothetical protein